MLKQEAPSLFRKILQGHFRLAEPLLDLLLQPIALQSAALIVLLLLPLPYIHIYAWAGLGIIAFYCATAVCLRREGWKDWAALATAPFYILWKLTMLPGIIMTSKKTDWKRTERDKEQQ